MHYEWHNKYLNKENSLFLTILNYFRQILVTFKYFVQSDWRIIVKKPGTAIQCKTKDSSCHRQSSIQVLSGIRAAQSSVFCVVFCRPLFIICPFSFGHCIAIFAIQGLRFESPFSPPLADLEYILRIRALIWDEVPTMVEIAIF
jgi:hypothetical protein